MFYNIVFLRSGGVVLGYVVPVHLQSDFEASSASATQQPLTGLAISAAALIEPLNDFSCRRGGARRICSLPLLSVRGKLGKILYISYNRPTVINHQKPLGLLTITFLYRTLVRNTEYVCILLSRARSCF